MSSVIRGNDDFDTVKSKSRIRLTGGNGFGSTNTRIRRFLTIREQVGTDITYTDSAAFGASFDIVTPGIYSITYTDNMNAAGDICIGINTVVGATLPTDLNTILAVQTNHSNGYRGSCSWTGYLNAVDQIRMYMSLPQGVSDQVLLTIARVF